MRWLRRLAGAGAATVLLGSGASAGGAQEPSSGEPARFAPRGLSEARFQGEPPHEAIRFTAGDGVELGGRVYRPPGADAGWRSGVILIPTPYANRALPVFAAANLRVLDRYEPDLVGHFTQRGYAVVLADVRGYGTSGGCTDWGGERDALDIGEWAAHLAGRPWSNGNVGAWGESYGAGLLASAIARGPKHLRTAVIDAGVSGLYEGRAFDGVPYWNAEFGPASYAPMAPAPGQQEPDPKAPADTVRDPQRPATHLRCVPYHQQEWAEVGQSGTMTPYMAERESRSGVRRIRASVLQVQGLSDTMILPVGLDDWFDDIGSFRRLILGQWGHANRFESRADYLDVLHAWFDHELLELPTAIEDWPVVQVQDDRRVWRAVGSYEGLAARFEELALLDDGALGEGRPAAEPRRWTELEPSLPTTRGGDDPAALVFPAVAEAVTGSVTFERPLERPLHLSGQALLEATITLDKPDGHIALWLDKVDEDGHWLPLTRGYLSVRHHDSLERPRDVPTGKAMRYTIRTQPFDAVVPAGHRLRLRLSGGDEYGRPLGNGYTAEIAVDGSSVLRLPIADESCGLLVAPMPGFEPKAPTPGCPDGVPTR